MSAAFSLLLLAACLPSAWLFEKKALDDYVAQVDPHYNYTLAKTEERLVSTIYWLNMTSQKWLDESEVDRSVWWHQMYIILPKDQTMRDSCLLFIDAGSNDDVTSIPKTIFFNFVVGLAESIRSCVVLLNQVPNQPITFHKIPLQECKNSTESDAVKCTWWMFLNNKTAPPHSLMEFANVKAAVRAMDTTTDFLLKESVGKMNITKFGLIGTSNRGLVAWLTAAVDGRVVLFSPIFYDHLNPVKTLHHEYRSLCGWSFALSILHDANITQHLDDPRFQELATHIDPLEYNARYSNKSKFIVKAAGDEIFLPDNTYFYWDELKGEKQLRVIPNVAHLPIIAPEALFGPIKAFYVATMQNLTMPQISWNRTETNTTGVIHLFTDQKPSSIKYYTANTTTVSERRDFRLHLAHNISNPVKWRLCDVEEVGTGVYKAEVKKPSTGWRVFYIEAAYLRPKENQYVFTTEVQIIPDTYPCPDCKGEDCYGELV